MKANGLNYAQNRSFSEAFMFSVHPLFNQGNVVRITFSIFWLRAEILSRLKTFCFYFKFGVVGVGAGLLLHQSL